MLRCLRSKPIKMEEGKLLDTNVISQFHNLWPTISMFNCLYIRYVHQHSCVDENDKIFHGIHYSGMALNRCSLFILRNEFKPSGSQEILKYRALSKSSQLPQHQGRFNPYWVVPRIFLQESHHREEKDISLVQSTEFTNLNMILILFHECIKEPKCVKAYSLMSPNNVLKTLHHEIKITKSSIMSESSIIITKS